MKMKPVSRVRALHTATLEIGPVIPDGVEWCYHIGEQMIRFPTYYQARDDRAQSIAEGAARRFLMSRGLPEKLTIPKNIEGSSGARFRKLLDALPVSIKAKF